MSDQIKHECGIALIRLRKPLDYYHKKYGTWTYGIQRLYLLMEKQHNRGQDGAGVASLKLNPQPGKSYIHRSRSNEKSSLNDVFDFITNSIKINSEHEENPVWAKENLPFAAELYLGHLRYGTFGGNSIDHVHPVMRASNWLSRNLVVAGNFNLTNTDEIYNQLLNIGQQPRDITDTVTILEEIGYYLDEENNHIYEKYKQQGLSKIEISKRTADEIDVANILKRATKRFDGGYTIAGMIGNGDAFVIRDPNGIRPAFYYVNDEIIAVASERPVLQTALDVRTNGISEIPPGAALIIDKDGNCKTEQIIAAGEKKSCSFERIYFSRGTDKEIYRERKKLGELLTDSILKAIDYDLDNTVFSFIPNTAETAFFGMLKGIEDFMLRDKQRQIIESHKLLNYDELWNIITRRPRYEKIAVKDAKLRTFITEGEARTNLVEHIYDITYGVIRRNQDNLVIIDDSIVRGTTLKRSIISILDRLEPRKIIVVSSCPQIRYPDCYGIDMSRMNEFCAFLAAIELLKEHGKEYIIEDVYKRCKAQENLNKEEIVNHVRDIYSPFTDEQIAVKIAQMLKPENAKAEVQLVFQSVENLHVACPEHRGDWYFTGNYPTPGGNKVVNKAFINYYEGKNDRPY
ncbi:MAG: amidophosphoribosyltransferase [Prevotellaceae bacterium]|jgi:amidophosphoribosyltransferase|nr:amidophosphoribosyltransferase [Prevotellaceae bacterium]